MRTLLLVDCSEEMDRKQRRDAKGAGVGRTGGGGITIPTGTEVLTTRAIERGGDGEVEVLIDEKEGIDHEALIDVTGGIEVEVLKGVRRREMRGGIESIEGEVHLLKVDKEDEMMTVRDDEPCMAMFCF